MAQLKITLTKSTNRAKAGQLATVKALGLKKLGSSVVKEDIPSIRGMVDKVSHLVSLEEI